MTGLFSFQRQRAYDVVGFDAGRDQQRQPHGLDHFVQRFDLRAQVVRHRRPVRFVFCEQLIAEGFSFGIKHHRNMAWLVLQQ
ncbi:hypothetical protein D3C78_982170 [compost metagenome]